MDKLDITFDYDEETDILEISLGTGEPSYSEEVDDLLLIDRGYFSGQITGFQIMDVRAHGIKQIQVKAFVQKAIKAEKQQLTSYLRQRTALPGLIQNSIITNPQIRDILSETV